MANATLGSPSVLSQNSRLTLTPIKKNRMNNKTREIADTPEKGKKRYSLYKAVIDRYKESVDSGYYLEAISLMESLITDRLESFLIYYSAMNRNESFKTLDACIRLFDKYQGLMNEDLLSRIVEWKNQRNHAVHEMAKIEEGDNTSFSQRYLELRNVANKGFELFKDIKQNLL